MKRKHFVTAGSVGIIILIGMTIAYFAGSDAVTNRFAASESVRIAVVEEHYQDRQTVAFAQKIVKDPKIVSEVDTPAVVFLRVTIPTVTASAEYPIHLIKSDGMIDHTYNNNEKISVFDYISDTANTDHLTDSNITELSFQYSSDWILLDDASGNGTYVFAYHQRLNQKNDETTTLFDAIQYKRILEHDIVDHTAEQILIEGFAIQADYVTLANGTVFETENKTFMESDKSSLKELYDKITAS